MMFSEHASFIAWTEGANTASLLLLRKSLPILIVTKTPSLNSIGVTEKLVRLTQTGIMRCQKSILSSENTY